MNADGAVYIDTSLNNDGVEEGFLRMQGMMRDVAAVAEKAGVSLKNSFSGMDISKPIANAYSKLKSLEQQLAAVTSDFKLAVDAGDDQGAERLAAKRVSLYDKVEAAREKLAIEIAAAAKKEALEEEKAAQRKAKSIEKEAAAKQRAMDQQIHQATKGVRRVNTRLREIISGALVFNAIGAGLRSMTSYIGSALKSNDAYAASLARLRGSLATAFQPIYETIIPALITMMNWLNMAVQVIGRFFAALTGRSYSQMQKNAKALNNQAAAIGGVGSAAKKAEKQLASFDEINKLASTDASGGGGGGGGGGFPVFEEIKIPSAWESAIDNFALRVKDILFDWDDLTAEDIAEKLVAGLTAIAGGLIGFALGGVGGAVIGMTVGAGLGCVLSSLIFDGDGALSQGELLAAVVSALAIIGGAAIGFAVGGVGGAAIGATIGLGITFLTAKAKFEDVENKFDQLADAVAKGSEQAFRTTDTGFVIPTAEQMLDLKEKISKWFKESSDDIINNFNTAARTTENGFIIPTREQMAQTAAWISQKFGEAKESVITAWGSVKEWFAQNVTSPLTEKFRKLKEDISKYLDKDTKVSLQGLVDFVTGDFSGNWEKAWNGVLKFLKGTINGIIGFINGMVRGITNGINAVLRALNKISVTIPEWVPAYGGKKFGFDLGYVSAPQIPYLAQGAVIPPNAPFMAVLGDQKHGTNIEAPLSTIQEAVAAVMGGQISAMMAGFEALLEENRELRRVVQGIEIGDSVIGEAASRYQHELAIMRGG